MNETATNHFFKSRLSGFEVELFTIGRNGYMSHNVDSILKSAKKHGIMKKECSHNIIEIASLPDSNIWKAIMNFLDDLENVIELSKDKGIFLFPFGTYPGEFQPIIRNDIRYQIGSRIHGIKRYTITGRCVGFHYHYSVPGGVFDKEKRLLKIPKDKSNERKFVNMYNFLVAADPALTTFMQSSPYYQGRFMGKDSRAIMWRGGIHLKSPGGLHAGLLEFGDIPPYMFRIADMQKLAKKRHSIWKSKVKKAGRGIDFNSIYGSLMSATWNPVKVTAIATVEERGMDMNYPTIVAGMGCLIKHAQEIIEKNSYRIVPSTTGIKNPFKLEDNIIYVPPRNYLRNQLQRNSLYSGLDNNEIFKYCRGLLDFAKISMGADKRQTGEPAPPVIDMVACSLRSAGSPLACIAA